MLMFSVGYCTDVPVILVINFEATVPLSSLLALLNSSVTESSLQLAINAKTKIKTTAQPYGP